MAPEVLSDDGSEYGAEVDWWGVGILAFELLTGKLPFEGNSPEKVKLKIQKPAVAVVPQHRRKGLHHSPAQEGTK